MQLITLAHIVALSHMLRFLWAAGEAADAKRVEAQTKFRSLAAARLV